MKREHDKAEVAIFEENLAHIFPVRRARQASLNMPSGVAPPSGKTAAMQRMEDLFRSVFPEHRRQTGKAAGQRDVAAQAERGGTQSTTSRS
jgi:hypothetical protein